MDGRPHGNEEMTEYYHALTKVKQTLKTRYLTCFWFSRGEGQLMNVFLSDCSFIPGAYILADTMKNVNLWGQNVTLSMGGKNMHKFCIII